jgi:hypothetical protein
VADYKNGISQDGGQFQLDSKKTQHLNDSDEQWSKLRTFHFISAYEEVNQEVSNIVQSSRTQKSTEQMGVSDMAELLKSMPKQEEMLKNYKIHIEMLTKVITAAKNRRMTKMIELEQIILSGRENTERAKNTMIVKAVSQISKELEQKDYLRLLMIYFACFELSPKDKETMLKSVQKE